MAPNWQINRRKMMQGLAASAITLSVTHSAIANNYAPNSHTLNGSAFGSNWRIVLDSKVNSSRVRLAVQEIITEIDNCMSPYKNNSALSRFNRNNTTSWQPTPPSICTVTKEALRLAHLTKGAFDPTIGPIVSRFGFGPIKGDEGQVGKYQDIHVEYAAIRKTTPSLTLDLCGIAKGYALDRIITGLEELGIDDTFVEIGGEVRTIGRHPMGREWRVAIEDPKTRSFSTQRIITPKGLALATSGHSVNGIKTRSETSHIIEPKLKRPAKQSLLSVSVLAPTAMEADALATALCAIGAIKGIELANELSLAAFFITDGTEAAPEVMTGDLPNYVII